jgi:hypothetical protein
MRRKKDSNQRETVVNTTKRNLTQKNDAIASGRFQNLLDWDVESSKRLASFMQSKLPNVTDMFENKIMEV